MTNDLMDEIRTSLLGLMSCSDTEMQDGDFARKEARRLLELIDTPGEA